MAIRAIAILSIPNTCVVLGFHGVVITLWQLAVVILTFGEEMKSYNKAINRTFFTSLRFGVASPLYPKTPLRKKCPLQRRYKSKKGGQYCLI
jgi:hypothetical protein